MFLEAKGGPETQMPFFSIVLKIFIYLFLQKMRNVVLLQSNFNVSEANRALSVQWESTLAAVNWVGTACVFADNKQEGWCMKRAAGV